MVVYNRKGDFTLASYLFIFIFPVSPRNGFAAKQARRFRRETIPFYRGARRDSARK